MIGQRDTVVNRISTQFVCCAISAKDKVPWHLDWNTIRATDEAPLGAWKLLSNHPRRAGIDSKHREGNGALKGTLTGQSGWS